MSTVISPCHPQLVREPGASYLGDNTSNLPPSSPRLIEVLVDVPFQGLQTETEEGQKLFTYKVPLEFTLQPGDIVSVPFGSQHVGAIAIRYVSQLPPGLTWEKIKSIEEIICQGFFPSSYWQLLEQVATYYQSQLIQVIRTALPPGLLGRSQRRIRLLKDDLPDDLRLFLNPSALSIIQLLQSSPTQDYTWQYIQRQVRGAQRGFQDLLKRGWVESYLEPPTPPRAKQRQAVTLTFQDVPSDLTPRQAEVLEILRRQGGELWLNDLLKICHTSSATIKALAEKGCVVISAQEVLRQEQGIPQIQDAAKVLNSYQTEALNCISQLSGFAKVLLHGVTGSGKTEVYLQAIAPILQQGKSALILVPEIGLTPQLTDRFRARFDDKVYVYHSALSDGERYDTWRNMIRGLPQIIIGTRSAIFAPLPKLGLIILDEEHDSSFKQDSPTPCYHARQVAQWRAELENCPLILGSATPSLETWLEVKGENHRQNHYYLSLPERIQSRPLPPIQVVDMRQELKKRNHSIFSESLQTALHRLKQEHQQGILFIHRRGHSTFVSCRSCGFVMECPHCDVSLAYHQTHEGATQVLRCHYCNHSELYPHRCPDCSSPYFKHFGSGTQRVTQELDRLFPQLRYIRFDSDTTRTKDSHRRLLTQFANGEADLLVGTQMLTKGLDLASVRLVGVVSADGLLHFSDYRANERAFQTLMQVAGRAGRGNDPGQVIIQTYTPDHAVIQALKRYEYEPFVKQELQHRQDFHYPPYGQLILLRLSGFDALEVEQTAQQLAEALQPEDQATANYEVLGPAPAPILRIAERYRWQILLKIVNPDVTALPHLSRFYDLCPRRVSLTIDVDPLHLG